MTDQEVTFTDPNGVTAKFPRPPGVCAACASLSATCWFGRCEARIIAVYCAHRQAGALYFQTGWLPAPDCTLRQFQLELARITAALQRQQDAQTH